MLSPLFLLMAYLKTLSQLRESIANQCDATVGDDEWLSEDELNDYINTELAWVHGMKIQSALSFDESIQTITASGVASYDLASDYFATVGVDALIDGYWCELYEAMPGERNDFQFSNPIPLAYRIVGDQLQLLPSTAVGSVRVVYEPACPVLTEDDDTFDFGNAWNELVEVGCCIKIREKEEATTTGFERRKEELLSRIKQEVELRALAQPRRLIETSRRYIDPYYAGRWASLVDDDY